MGVWDSHWSITDEVKVKLYNALVIGASVYNMTPVDYIENYLNSGLGRINRVGVYYNGKFSLVNTECEFGVSVYDAYYNQRQNLMVYPNIINNISEDSNDIEYLVEQLRVIVVHAFLLSKALSDIADDDDDIPSLVLSCPSLQKLAQRAAKYIVGRGGVKVTGDSILKELSAINTRI